VLGFALLGPARAEGQPRDVRVARRGRRARARVADLEAAARVVARERPAGRHGLSHSRPAQTGAGRCARIASGRAEGVTLRFDPTRRAIRSSSPRDGARARRARSRRRRAVRRLGGDGTILRALRPYAGTSVPVSPSTTASSASWPPSTPRTTSDDLPRAPRRGAAGDFEVAHAPGARARDARTARTRRSTTSRSTAVGGKRVAELSYAIDGEEPGRCAATGLVLATPAGSTGYNLANGGRCWPGAWRASSVSFNRAALADGARAGRGAGRPAVGAQPLPDEVDISLDGRRRHVWPGEAIPRRSCARRPTWPGPGSSFYRRMRQKFGAAERSSHGSIVIAGGHGRSRCASGRLSGDGRTRSAR
jgi:NAD+ kinase